MSKRTLEEIEAEIAETKAQIESVKGDETEVYARIVGYYRAVKNWNKGKKDEYHHRKLFKINDGEVCASLSTPEADRSQEVAEENHKASLSAPEAQGTGNWHYELYSRATCPHCPPVKAYMENVSLEGRKINVDTDEGMNLAAEHGVFSTPTVIFYNEKGDAVARAHTTDELEAILLPLSKNVKLAEAIA